MTNDPQREARFRAWLAEYRGVFHRIARAYSATPEDQADLFQDMAVQLWRSLPGFRGQCQPVTWIYRVCLNTALGWQRGDHQRRHLVARDTQFVELARSDEPRPGWTHEKEELLAELYARIRELPPGERSLVLLSLEGLSYREISELTGLTENHVGVTLSRARQKLAASLKEVRDADYWQELWRQQPVPGPMDGEDRMLRHVQDTQEEWEEEWKANDRMVFLLVLTQGLPILGHILLGDNFQGVNWLLLVLLVGFAGLHVVFRWRRRRLERDFGPTVIERIERGQALLRQRMKFDDITLLFGPLLAVSFGAVAYRITDRSMWSALVCTAILLPVIGWWLVADWRKRRARIEQQLGRFQAIRTQLTKVN